MTAKPRNGAAITRQRRGFFSPRHKERHRRSRRLRNGVAAQLSPDNRAIVAKIVLFCLRHLDTPLNRA